MKARITDVLGPNCQKVINYIFVRGLPVTFDSSSVFTTGFFPEKIIFTSYANTFQSFKGLTEHKFSIANENSVNYSRLCELNTSGSGCSRGGLL